MCLTTGTVNRETQDTHTTIGKFSMATIVNSEGLLAYSYLAVIDPVAGFATFVACVTLRWRPHVLTRTDVPEIIHKHMSSINDMQPYKELNLNCCSSHYKADPQILQPGIYTVGLLRTYELGS